MNTRLKMFLILLSISLSAVGQNSMTFRIIDQETKKPVKDASVHILDKNLETTSNYLGYFQITADTSDYLIIEKKFYETGVIKTSFDKGVQIQITKRKHSDYEGGLEKLTEYLLKNIRYPQKARINGTQGRFYVSFTIDSLGQISNINAIKDIGNDCGLAVTELLEKVPNRWIPAETMSTFILPLTFRLADSKIKIKEIQLPEGLTLAELVITAYGIDR